jgi:sec-independent protein translocase protein TatC
LPSEFDKALEETISSKKKKPPRDTSSEMSFWDHLSELRWRLIRSVVVVVILALAAMINREFIFDKVILAPLSPDFLTTRLLCALGTWLQIPQLCLDNSSLQIINITMSGQFMTHMYISLMAGLIVGFPYVVWEMWKFVKPALHDKERRYSSGAVFTISLLFLCGAAFSYYLLVPLTINFLGTYQVSGSVANQVSLASYISTVVSLTFSVGLVFELPALVYVLARVGIINGAMMRRFRKVMFIVILVVAGIITPPDVFSQILVTLPLVALYEAGILVADRTAKKTQNAEK